jgi:hypothetical protein
MLLTMSALPPGRHFFPAGVFGPACENVMGLDVATCPVADRALVAIPYAPTDMPTWYEGVEMLLPGIRRILDTMPPHPSHLLWLNWGPSPPREDMAYSLEDEPDGRFYSWMGRI